MKRPVVNAADDTHHCLISKIATAESLENLYRIKFYAPGSGHMRRFYDQVSKAFRFLSDYLPSPNDCDKKSTQKSRTAS